MKKIKRVTILLRVKCVGEKDYQSWIEEYNIDPDSIKSYTDYGKSVVRNFNKTLKLGEKRRKFVSVVLK